MKLQRILIMAVALLALSASASRAQTKPQIEDATVAADGKGAIWLGFVVKNPNGGEFAVQVKVQRPVAEAPEPGLPAPVIGPGGRGSWLWIGEGRQKGMAALFNLDTAENLTWIVLSPQSATKYIPTGQPP